jgi:hypothetical protein
VGVAAGAQEASTVASTSNRDTTIKIFLVRIAVLLAYESMVILKRVTLYIYASKIDQ